MSRLKTDAIRNTSASADALTFDTSGNTKIADSKELQLGTGGDLQIFHDGSNSYIKDSGTGNLVLATSELSINNAASNEEMIKATQNGAVELFYDNAKKIETTATGINVTGQITASAQPGFSAYGGSVWQTVTDGNWSTMQFGFTHHNDGNDFNTSNDIFTCGVAGVYQLNFAMYSRIDSGSSSTSSEYAAMRIYKNGTGLDHTWSIDHYYDDGDFDNTCSNSCLIKLAVNDYLELKFYSQGRDWKYFPAHSHFSAHLLS